MKKNILFVIPSLHLGGAEKSLVNLLNSIDSSQYEIDLFLFSKKGSFLELVPKFVNLIDEYEPSVTFSKSFISCLFSYLKKFQFGYFYHKIAFTIKNKMIKNRGLAEQKTWINAKVFLPIIDKNYDVAIGYLEKSSVYFITDNVIASTKIGWIHTDLEALKLNLQFEVNYLKQLNYIVTVSDGLKERLSNILPHLADKMYVIENINSAKVIIKMANVLTDFDFDKNYENIVYVGRLEKEKGLFNAVNAVKLLVDKGIKVRFYLIGNGALLFELKEFVLKNNLEESIYFLGIQMNPYTFIKKADIFMLTSFYEGKSISLEEAKILHKPIVVTNFKSATDQIEDNETGLIVEKNPEAIASAIEKIIRNLTLKEKLINNLKNSAVGNENEVEIFYQLIK